MRRLLTYLLPVLIATLPARVFAIPALLPACASGDGNCTTCDFLVLFVNWAELILYGLSALSVLMICIGGFMWILAAGNTELVQKGRQIMVGVVVGLLFAFLGYLIVNVTIASLLGTKDFEKVQLFGTDWNTFCEPGLTPGGAVLDCAKEDVGDGTRCSTESCNDEGFCVCLAKSCVDLCTYTVAQSGVVGMTSTCELSATSCTDAGGESSGPLCEGALTCCTKRPEETADTSESLP